MSRPLGLPVVRSSAFAFDSATLLGHLAAGDEVTAPADCYGGTWSLLTRWLPRWGMHPVLVDIADLAAVRAAVTPRTRMIYAETIANPTLTVPDLPALGQLAHDTNSRLVVDSTFATPVVCRPLEHGADLVVHSATKFLGGHADATGGVAIGRREHLGPVREARIDLGGCLAPDEAFLLHRGLETLTLRVARQSATAALLAAKLAGHSAIAQVRYPGLAAHPQHGTARRLFRAGLFGSLITAAAGIAPGQVRLSVGVEDPEALLCDLRQAFDAT